MAFEALAAELTLDSKGFVAGMSAAEASMSGVESQASSMRNAVGMAGAGLAAVSAGGLALATKAASDFQDSMIEVEKVTSKEFASGFRDDILEMTKTIPLAATEIADLTAQAGRFGVAEEHIKSFVESTAKMAEATDVSTSKAGEAFAKLATLTGTPIPKMENLGSAINSLSNNFATSSQEIVDSMLRSAGSLAQLNMSATDMAGLSAALNAVSESSERAGSRIRRLAQEMMDPKKAMDLAAALGMNVEKFRSMVKTAPTNVIMQMAEAMGKSGSAADQLNSTLSTTSRQALAGLGSNLKQTRKALNLSGKAFKENASLQKEFDAAMESASAQAKLLKNSIMRVAIQIGDVLLPHVTKAIKGLTGLVNRFSALNEASGGMLGVLVGLAGVIGGLVVSFGAFAPILTTAASAASTMAPALASVLVPAGILIGVIGTLAAVFSGKFPEAATAAGDAIWKVRQYLLDVGNWIATKGVQQFKKAIQTLANRALEAWTFTKEKIIPAVRTALKGAWNWVRTKGVALATQALNALVREATAAFQFTQEHIVPKVKTALNGAWTWVRTKGVALAKQALIFLGQQALNAFTFTREKILPKVKTALQGIWNWVRTEGVTLAKSALKFLAKASVKAFKFGKKHLAPRINDAINTAATWLRENGVPILKAALSALATGAIAAFNFGTDHVVPAVKAGINAAVDWLKTSGLSIFKGAFRTLGKNIGPALMAIQDAVMTAFREGIPKVREWLKNNGPGIIKAGFKAIGTAIRTLILSSWAITGMIGQAIVSTITGIYNWLKDGGATKLKNAFLEIVGGIVTYLKNDAWGDLKGAAEFLFDAVIAAAEGLWEGLIGNSVIKDMMKDIFDYFRGQALTDLLNAAKAMFNATLDWVTQTFVPNTISALEGLVGDTVKWLKKTGKKLMRDGFETIAQAAIDGYNATMPDRLTLPQFTIPRASVTVPDVPGIPGLDGQSVGVGPFGPFGGQSFNIPQLATGGLIEDDGLAMLHAGERVVPAAQVRDRGPAPTGDIHIEAPITIEGDADRDTARQMRRELEQVVREVERQSGKR